MRQHSNGWLVMAAVVLILLQGAGRAGACSLPIEPDMKLDDNSKPAYLYEDEVFPWRINPTRFPTIGYTFWFFPANQSGRRQDGALGQALARNMLVPENWKTFPIDVGRKSLEKYDAAGRYVEPIVYGASYSKRISQSIASGRRTAFSGYPFSRTTMMDLPGRLPAKRHHPNFEAQAPDSVTQKEKLLKLGPKWLRDILDGGGNVPRNLIVYSCPATLPASLADPDADGPIKVVEVFDETYVVPTEWTISDWAVDWDMDRENIGYNPGDRFMGTQAINYDFAYVTPSDPGEYTVEINMAVSLDMKATWTWYEQVRNPDGTVAGTYGPYKMRLTGIAYKSSSGLGTSSAVPEVWIVRVLDKTPPMAYELVTSEPGIDPYRLYGTTGNLLSDWNASVMGKRSGNPRNPDSLIIRVLENNPHMSVNRRGDNTDLRHVYGNLHKISLAPGMYYEFSVSDFAGPWACPVHHEPRFRQYSSGTCPVEGRNGPCGLPLERDFLEYKWHVTTDASGTETLQGEGETFKYVAGQMQADDMIVVRDKYFEGWRINVELTGTENPQQTGLFHARRESVRVLYSVQMYDYQRESGWMCGKPGQDHGYCDCVAVNHGKFVWVEIPVSDAGKVVKVYDADGREIQTNPAYGEPVRVPSGDGERSDPAYSVMEVEVPIADFLEPLGWHFATTSRQYTDPWGTIHRGWDNGGRLKYFVAVDDGSGNRNPPYWWPGDCKRTVLETAVFKKWRAGPGLEDWLAAADLRDGYVRSGKGTGESEAVPNSAWGDWPSLPGSFDPPHYAAWPLQPPHEDDDMDKGVAYPLEFGDLRRWGQYGHIIVVDDDVPNIKLNVRENALKRVFSFGDILWGDYRRLAYHESLKTDDMVYTRTNRDTLRPAENLLVKSEKLDALKGVGTTRIYMAEENAADEWCFDARGKDGYQEMGRKIMNGSFNPWCYRLSFTGNELMYGLWTTEDVRLSFDLNSVGMEIRARDNINEFKTGAEAGGITTPFNEGTKAYETFVLMDGNDKAFEQEMSYVFRTANVYDPQRDCFVKVGVEDQLPPILSTADGVSIATGGPLQRLLKVYFYVVRAGMSRITLEEQEKSKE